VIDHHPYDEMLLDFATGAQPQAVSLAVGGHLRYCPACRGVVDDLEAVGGELIRRIEPAAIREDALAACLAIADEGGDCICLLVLDAPLAFRTVEGARLGPLLAT
jgi:anti-sigma factor ChrR (cupin superfamily)